MNKLTRGFLTIGVSVSLLGCGAEKNYDDPAVENPDTGATALNIETSPITETNTVSIQRVGSLAVISTPSN